MEVEVEVEVEVEEGEVEVEEEEEKSLAVQSRAERSTAGCASEQPTGACAEFSRHPTQAQKAHNTALITEQFGLSLFCVLVVIFS